MKTPRPIPDPLLAIFATFCSIFFLFFLYFAKAPNFVPNPVPLIYSFDKDDLRLAHLGLSSNPVLQRMQAITGHLRIYLIAQIAALVTVTSSLVSSFAAEPSKVTPDEALKQLVEGNARFVSGHLTHAGPEQIAEARGTLSKGQSPFAVIVGCSDSRVGPEIVFDQGLGDLFVVRTAVVNSPRSSYMPRGLRVVVAGADVGIAADKKILLAHHQRGLAVRLSPTKP